jgi:hypothetical protein
MFNQWPQGLQLERGLPNLHRKVPILFSSNVAPLAWRKAGPNDESFLRSPRHTFMVGVWSRHLIGYLNSSIKGKHQDSTARGRI